MATKLYVLPASHPCATAEAALELKGIDFERVDLLPLVAIGVAQLRYGARTVPGLRIEATGERIVGSRQILRKLDELVPDPPLLPADPALRERVLEAERWGDETLQPEVRRIVWATLSRRPAAIEAYAGDAKLPLPIAVLRPTLGIVSRLSVAKNRASESNVRHDLAMLPARLEQIDAWIADGVLAAGETANAADLQIGSSIRLLRTIADIAPLIAGRPCEQLADYFPPASGETPAGTLPADWVPS